MDLALGRGEFSKARGSFMPWRQVNMLLEPTPTDPKQFNLLSRPPLAAYYLWGTGPVQGVFQRNNLFGGSVFAVIGADGARVLYKDGVSLGAVNGTGPVIWAAGFDELVVTGGATAYSYNGTTLAAIAFPDSANIRSVNWMARRFIFVRDGSSRFYWSEVDDGRTIMGDSFANAESSQDTLLDIRKQGDGFWMLGYETGEFWILTGDDALPWSKVPQRYLSRGIQDTGCAQEIEGTVYFIASDGMVCMIQENAIRISDGGLDEKIRASTEGSTFWYAYEGKVIFCLRLDSGTFGLDLGNNNQTVEFQTFGRAHWAPKCAIMVGSEALFGDDTAGTIYIFDAGATTDSGAAQLTRIFSAGVPITEGQQPIVNIIVQGDNGGTTATTGEAADPILEMHCSRDGGRTFGEWRASKWGAMGEFTRRARFGSCGMFGAPGFLAEFRMQQVAPLRISQAVANATMAGRGR